MSTLLLTLDTALSNLQLALWAWPASDGESPACLWQYGSDPGCERTKASMMLPVLHEGLAQTGFQPGDIQHLAINCGPGSFTGIRSGMVVARTIGQWFPVQCYAFNSFELIAATVASRHPSAKSPTAVTIILNAYRQQHLRAVVDVDTVTGQTQWREEPHIIDNSQAPDQAPSDTVWLDETLAPLLNDTTYQALHKVWGNTSEGTLGGDLNQHMAYLVTQKPDQYQRTWENLVPLYYQQPHITLKTVKTP